MEGERLRVGAAMMGFVGVCLTLFGLASIGLAFRGSTVSQADLPDPITPLNWATLDPGMTKYVALVMATAGLFAILAGVGAFGVGVFGVRRGEYWAWIIGVVAASCFTAALVVAHLVLGDYAAVRLIPLDVLLVIYGTGLGLTRRFMT